MRREFTCGSCGEVFWSDWTDEDAQAEALAAGFSPEDLGAAAVVCDSCYGPLMGKR